MTEETFNCEKDPNLPHSNVAYIVLTYVKQQVSYGLFMRLITGIINNMSI